MPQIHTRHFTVRHFDNDRERRRFSAWQKTKMPTTFLGGRPPVFHTRPPMQNREWASCRILCKVTAVFSPERYNAKGDSLICMGDNLICKGDKSICTGDRWSHRGDRWHSEENQRFRDKPARCHQPATGIFLPHSLHLLQQHISPRKPSPPAPAYHSADCGE